MKYQGGRGQWVINLQTKSSVFIFFTDYSALCKSGNDWQIINYNIIYWINFRLHKIYWLPKSDIYILELDNGGGRNLSSSILSLYHRSIWKGSKGIRQLPVNCSTYPMIIKQNNVDHNYWLKRLNTQPN